MPRGRPKRPVAAKRPSADAQRVYDAIAQAAKAGMPPPDATRLAAIGARRNCSGLIAELSRHRMVQVDRRAGGSTDQKRYFVPALSCWTGWLVMRDSRIRTGAVPQPTLELHGYLQELARSAAALPTSEGMAQAMSSTRCSIDGRLRALRNAGMIRLETGTNRRTRRIFVVAVDRWTGWSKPPLGWRPADGKLPAILSAVEAARIFEGLTFEDRPGFGDRGRLVMIDPRRLGFVPTASSAALAVA